MRSMEDDGEERVIVPNNREQDSSTGLTLSKAHLSTRSSHAGDPLTARQTILQAVESLETENDRLHQVNEHMAGELEELRRENAQLRRQLEHYCSEADNVNKQQSALQQDNQALRRELERHTTHVAQESRRYKEQELLVNMVKQENAKHLQQIDSLREEAVTKDRELRKALRELQVVTGKLERASRKNFNDRDIELLHEVELLKDEKRDLIQEKDHLEQKNVSLCNEMANLQNTLDQQLSELKNENRRHALLTKEFNSLLEENNHLKLQLRRRNRHGTAPSSKDAEAIETVQKINREPSNMSNLSSSRKFHSSTNLPITRESTFITKEDGSTRDLTLTSRERTVLSRERTGLRRQGSSIRLNNIAVSREGSGDSNRDSNRGSADGAQSVRTNVDSPTTSDTLPSIAGTGRTWKP